MMKWPKGIKYFLFTGFNWGWGIAFWLLKDNAYGAKKYKLSTTGYDTLKALKKEGVDTSQATLYMPVSYKLLEELFNHINLSTCKHFIDIGCGMGRAVCVAAFYDVPKITGIDFSEALCRQAQANCKLLPAYKGHLFIICINAMEYTIPDDADCIYLFNPFSEIIMKQVVANIMLSLSRRQRQLIIIYVNPLHKECFTKAGFTISHHIKKLRYLEAVVMRN